MDRGGGCADADAEFISVLDEHRIFHFNIGESGAYHAITFHLYRRHRVRHLFICLFPLRHLLHQRDQFIFAGNRHTRKLAHIFIVILLSDLHADFGAARCEIHFLQFHPRDIVLRRKILCINIFHFSHSTEDRSGALYDFRLHRMIGREHFRPFRNIEFHAGDWELI